MNTTLLSFGAKSVDSKILEKTLTVRKSIVDEIEKKIIEKVKKKSTYQSLIIAPRGSGKTHIIKVLYDRLKSNNTLSDKMIIAFMSEDEVGIANYTDLLISIIRSFIRYNEIGSESLNEQIAKASNIREVTERNNFIKDIINNYTKEKIIILLIENFNKILKDLSKNGQQKLRDFIHQYNNLSIIATSQSLIENLKKDDFPFYNFFNIHHLKKLTYEETVEFINAMTDIEGKKGLKKDINKPSFVGKLKAIYELTEGNHRLLVTFYSFLKAEYKSELSKVFVKTMNDLKPYYEQFVNNLPAQEQKIVKYLSLSRKAVNGKTIATDCFIYPNASKQLSNLNKKGMIDKHKSGSDAYYELKEPLLRICFEIGENPNGISKLFVDFLSSFYEQKRLKKDYIKFKYGARFQQGEAKRKYEKEAIMYKKALVIDELKSIVKHEKDFEQSKSMKDLLSKIEIITEEEIEIINLKSIEEKINAISDFEKRFTVKPSIFSNLLVNSKSLNLKEKNKVYHALERLDKNKIDELVKIFKTEKQLFIGNSYFNKKQYLKAIDSYQQVIKINPKNDKAFYNMGITYRRLKQYDKAIECYQKAIEINPKKEEAFYNMGITYRRLKQYQKAIDSYQKATKLNPKNEYALNSLGRVYLEIDKIDKAISTFKKAIKIHPNDIDIKGSLLGAYIKMNDLSKCKKIFIQIIEKADDKLLNALLVEDVLNYTFKNGSDYFLNEFFMFVVDGLSKVDKSKFIWNVLPEALFEILINIEDYSLEKLQTLDNLLQQYTEKYPVVKIPLIMYQVGVAYLKNKEKNAIYELSKEERKVFTEQVLDKRK